MRSARMERVTKETSVVVELGLDGTGTARVSTGVPFFDHMLAQLAKHGLLDLAVTAEGDTEIDAHHTVRTPRSPSARCCARRSVTSPASAGSATPWSRWTRRWPGRPWTCPGGPTWSIPSRTAWRP